MDKENRALRMVSWWIRWDDLNWPSPDNMDRIRRRADEMAEAAVVANHLVNESQVSEKATPAQPDLFTDYEALEKQEAAERAELEKEKRLQQAILEIKKKLGKNAVLKGMNLLDGATAKERNEQIGGHRK